MAPDPTSREALIRAAKHVFLRHGFEGATVKEIADEAGLNVSLVSYYFEGKAGLYRTCFEEFGKSRLEAAKRILTRPSSEEEFKVRLKLFIEEVYIGHLEQPEVTLIVHRECGSEMPITKDIFKEVFLQIFATLQNFITDAQALGILRKDIDPHLSCLLFFGGVIHISRIDTLHKEMFGQSISDHDYREQVIHHAIDIFFNGTRPSRDK